MPAVPASEILAVLLTLPQYLGDVHADPTIEDRTRLLRPVAVAISEVARNVTEAAALVAVAYSESALARYVVQGYCSQGPAGARCDAGLSRGVWQVRSWCRELWAGPETAEGRHLAGARCAVQRLRQGQRQCSGKGYIGIQAYYGTGRCAWRPATGRAKLMALVEGKLRSLHVSPGATGNREVNGCAAYPECRSYGAKPVGLDRAFASIPESAQRLDVAGAHSANNLRGELGVWQRFADQAPPLALPVSGVVGACAKEQVLWAHAPRVVAAVENAEFPRVFSGGDDPTRSVSAAHRAKSPVPLRVQGTRPNPAGTKLRHVTRNRPTLLDLRPKPSYRFLIHERSPRGSGPGRVVAPRGFFQG